MSACLVSVIVPCFNEESTLETLVERVLALRDRELDLELILVDDASRDRSPEIARSLMDRHKEIRVLTHERNRGKGAAIRTGLACATGDYIAVQDADLEYDPQDLKRLLGPLRRDVADVVIGSRFLTSEEHRVLYFWHYVGNKFLTLCSNMMTDLNLTDMECCYKVFKAGLIKGLRLREDRFGFEPEIVAKIARSGARVYEMGISYHGRTYAQGKKIGWRDGLQALYCILRYKIFP